MDVQSLNPENVPSAARVAAGAFGFLISQALRLIVCRRLLRFEFLYRGIKIRRFVVGATDRFDMAAVVEGAAIIKAGLFDDVAHAVHERRTMIPTCLNIAGGTDVVVRTSDTRAPRGPAPSDIGRNLKAP